MPLRGKTTAHVRACAATFLSNHRVLNYLAMLASTLGDWLDSAGSAPTTPGLGAESYLTLEPETTLPIKQSVTLPF